MSLDFDPTSVAARRSEDAEDLQRELSGTDTTRMRRFLDPDDERTPRGRAKKQQREFSRLLAELLQDPQYAALYWELDERLSAAEIEADRFIAEFESKLMSLDQDLEQMEGDAARSPDGQLVFRTADGRVVDRDGRALPMEIAAGIIWPRNAPSAETYFAARSRRDNIASSLEDWETYRRDTLGDIRNRHDDEEAPMTKDQMREALVVIDEKRPELGSVEIVAPSTASVSVASMSALSLPQSLR